MDLTPTRSPEAVGFSQSRLDRIRPVMQRYIDRGEIAGILTLVARRGQVVHCETVGMADIEAGRPMRTDTLFRIYSMTKPITSVAVLMLMEEGALRLTDPIARFLPAFTDTRVWQAPRGETAEYRLATRPITILHLLTHTSGLCYGMETGDPIDTLYKQNIWDSLGTEPGQTLETFVNKIAQLPLANQPGEAFRYSLATDVLGLLVQVASGIPFEQFIRERILAPLGMIDTDFYVPSEKRERFAALYGLRSSGDDPTAISALPRIDSPGHRYEQLPSCPMGGSGLVSTAGDYLRFARMLLDRGEYEGVRLLGRKTAEWMRMNHLPDGVPCLDDPALGFGLGVYVIQDAIRAQRFQPASTGNLGWTGAASTEFFIDPEEDMIGIVMLQSMPFWAYPVASDFRAMVYQALVD